VLFAAAIINLFTKEMATVSGVAFTLMFYAVFVASERATARAHAGHPEHTDQFQLLREADVGLAQLGARPGGVLVPVRDYNTLTHLDRVLTDTDTAQRDVVVMTSRLLTGPDAGTTDIEHEELFTDYEQRLFTRVVAVAERHGRAVKLLVIPSVNIFDAVAQTAVRLEARDVALGESAKMSAADQAHLLGEAWDRTPHPAERTTRLIVYAPDGRPHVFSLGAHAPNLTMDDIAHIHRLWLDAVKTLGPSVHHRDIVTAALGSYEDELAGPNHDRALSRLRHEGSLT